MKVAVLIIDGVYEDLLQSELGIEVSADDAFFIGEFYSMVGCYLAVELTIRLDFGDLHFSLVFSVEEVDVKEIVEIVAIEPPEHDERAADEPSSVPSSWGWLLICLYFGYFVGI